MADNNTTTTPGATPPGDGTGVTPNPDGATPNGQPNPNQTQQPNTQTQPAKTDLSTLPADVQEHIRNLNRENEDRRKKLKAFEDSQANAETERLKNEKKFEELAENYRKEAEKEKAERAKLERSLLVAKIVAKHKLPEDLADMLTGDTEADLEANAAKLAKHIKPPTAANTEGGAGSNNRQSGGQGAGNNQGGQGQQQQRPYAFQQPGDVSW